jgi:eukaryotic-like serine/threonine-protein kinase
MYDRDDRPHGQVRLCGEEFQPGTTLGDRFVVLRRIAATGLSTVYQGVDRSSGRGVAIKRLATAARPGDLPRASAVRAFQAEAQLLRTFEHPQLPRLRAAFRDHDDYVMVTDYVAGISLDALIAERAVTPEMAWSIAAGLCDAVAALHLQDPPLIHADIKSLSENLISCPPIFGNRRDYGNETTNC